APSDHTVKAVFSGVNPNFTAPPNATKTLTITQEDARADYSGNMLFWTSSATSSTATVTFAATIRDISAVTGDPAYDAYAGDIRNATVTFVNRDSGNATLCTAPVVLLNSSDTKVGTATCTTSSLSSGSTSGSQYTIGTMVSGYYMRNDEGDDTVITVAQPIT